MEEQILCAAIWLKKAEEEKYKQRTYLQQMMRYDT